MAFAAVCLPLFGGTPMPTEMLRYDKPAAKWVEALAIGNDRMAAMGFGGVYEIRPAK